jgi:apolipoprotein D and lipocalin family protein
VELCQSAKIFRIYLTNKIVYKYGNMRKFLVSVFGIAICSSVIAQKYPKVAENVDLTRYAGKWYEIARLPNSFEKRLKCISATYVLRKDGRVDVLNEGVSINDPGKSSKAKGLAWVPDKNSPTKLKVRFFWPFSGDYWILYLDKEYRYVLVGDPSYKYLWILSRTRQLEETVYSMLLQKAAENGFDLKSLIKVDQECK